MKAIEKQRFSSVVYHPVQGGFSFADEIQKQSGGSVRCAQSWFAKFSSDKKSTASICT